MREQRTVGPPDAPAALIGAGGDDEQAAILARRVDLYVAATPMSLLAVLLNAAILGFVLPGSVDQRLLGAWLALTLTLSVLRWLGYRWLRGPDSSISTVWRMRWAVLGTLASGLLWGGASILLFPVGDPTRQAMLAVVLAGITAGAVNTLSMFVWSAWAFLALVLVPFAIQLLSARASLGMGLGLLVVLYLIMLCMVSRRYQETLLESLRVGHARERAEATIVQQAYHDGLTGLPNRRLLDERLRHEIARSDLSGRSGALLVVDLDRFKVVNDSLGRDVGTVLIRTLAQRLSAAVGGADTLARIDGDRFVVVLPDLADSTPAAAHRARQGAEQLRARINEPCRIDDEDLTLSASVGIALFPGDADTPQALLHAAESAVRGAKQAGRDCIRFFLPEMQAAAIARMEMERALRRALRDNALTLYFQPQCDRRGQIVAAEALLRWPRGRGDEEMVSPPRVFVPLAEECGLIHELGNWVFDEALRRIGALAQLPGPFPLRRLSVNVSAAQFREPDFVAALTRRMNAARADPHWLELELTEHTLVADFPDSARKMEQLRGLGVHFSIDDFGTGYSSLSYLKRLPLDALKIDRSFVQDVPEDPSDAAIVEAIMEMAHRLGLRVVAEGVDRDEIKDFLDARSCDRYQGFLLHRPMPFARLTALLQAQAGG